MSKKLFTLFITSAVTVLLVALNLLEKWTLVEHALEYLRKQGPIGEFAAGVLTSPITPLVLALVAVAIGIDLWKERGRARGREAKVVAGRTSSDANPETNNSANSSAAATTGSITQNLYFSPQPATPVPAAAQPVQREETLQVDVDLAPWEGPSEKMFLIVTNRGPKQSFRGQCRVLGRRYDPNPQQKVMFDLNWQSGDARPKSLARGESANLLIASAGEDKERGLEWLRLEPARGQQATDSRWLWTETKRPEYDLEIVILGDMADAPLSEQFTLRAGSVSALEMYRRYVRIDSPLNQSEVTEREYRVRGAVGIPRASVQTFVYAGGQWHSQGDVVVKGQAWEGLCWFGDKDTMRGDYTLVAVADGDIPKGKYKELPERGCRSPEIKVQLRRLIPPTADVGKRTS